MICQKLPVQRHTTLRELSNAVLFSEIEKFLQILDPPRWKFSPLYICLYLYGITSFIYGTPNTLIPTSPTHPPFKAVRGVRQGDPLGPMLFSIAIQGILDGVKADYSDLKIWAYLDDVTIVGNPERVIQAYEKFMAGASQIGLENNESKCKLSTHCAEQYLLFKGKKIRQEDKGQKLLGAFVSNERKVKSG